MNKIYRVVWNKSTQTWTAVSEYATAQGKSSSRSAVTGSEVKSTKGIRFIYTALASATLMLVSGQAMATTVTGGNGYDVGVDNYCYYDTDSESVVCGDSTTSNVKRVDTKTAKSVVVGKGATNTGESNVAIGNSSSSAETASVAIGNAAKALHNQTVAIGQNAETHADWDISIGRFAGQNTKNPSAEGRNIAIGDGALKSATSPNNNTAIGTSAGEGLTGNANVMIGTYANSTNVQPSGVTASNTVAIGDRALAATSSSVAIGNRVKATGGISVAIGASAEAKGSYSIAHGYAATATGTSSIAIGSAQNTPNQTRTNGNYATAIGFAANAGAEGAIAIGRHANHNPNGAAADPNKTTSSDRAKTTGVDSIAIGTDTNATAKNAVSVGTNSRATGENAIAQGTQANAGANGAIAMGIRANAESATVVRTTGANSIAIGTDTHAGANHGVAIGSNASTSTTGQGSVALGASSKAYGVNAAAVGQASEAAGQNSFAAGNDSHALGKSAVAIGDGAGKGTILYEDPANPKKETGYTGASGDSSTAVGTYTRAKGVGATAVGVSADAQKYRSVATGAYSAASADSAIAIGDSAQVSEKGLEAVWNTNTKSYDTQEINSTAAIAVGKSAVAKGTGSVAVGHQSKTEFMNSTAVGNETKAVGYNSSAFGFQATAKGVSSVAIGDKALAGTQDDSSHVPSTNRGVAIGTNTNATGETAVALGSNAESKAHRGTALGVLSKAAVHDGVALGAYSIAKRDKGVTGADPLSATTDKENSTWKATHAAVSVGNDTAITDDPRQGATTTAGKFNIPKVTRQITGVAAGSQDTDAVNVAQLKVAGFVLATTADTQAGGIKTTSNTTNTDDKIINGETLTLKAGQGVAINQDGSEVTISTQQQPVVYTNADGDKLYLVEKDDPNAPGTKIKVFNTKPDGTGNDVDPPNVIASMQNATGNTKHPMTLTNVATGVRANDAVNVSQLGDAGIYNTDDNGNLAYTDGNGETVYRKPDGSYVNAQGGNVTPRGPLTLQNKGLNFAGNSGTGNTKLGETWNIVGGNAGANPTDPRTFTDGAFSGGNIKTTVKDGVVEITMADSPKFGDIVINTSSEGVQGQPDYKAAGRITGVADGVDDKDVATVKQLKEKTATTPLTVTSNKVADLTDADKSKLATAGDIADAINNTGFTLTTAKTNDGELGANATNELIKAGDSVTIEADNNIKLTQDNGKITIATKKDVKFDSVIAGGTKLDNGGLTFVDDNGGVVANSPSITKTGINAGGNKITNVDAGTDDSDAVNVGQLKAVNTKAGVKTKVTQGDGVTVTNKGTAEAPSYEVALSEKTKGSLGKADSALQTVKSIDKNLLVTKNGSAITLDFRDDPTFGKVTTGTGTNQVILDNTGVNVGGNTYISDAGLNANSKKVTNVANGAITADSKDAVNGGQLRNTVGDIANIIGGNAKVDNEGNVTASNIGGTGKATIDEAIKASKTTVSSNDSSIKVTKTTSQTTGADNYDISVNAQGLAESAQLPVVYTKKDGTKVYKVGDKFFSNKAGTGTEVPAADIIASMQNADGTTATPTTLANVADGDVNKNSKDAVNGSQLFAQGEGVKNIIGGNTTYDPADGTYKNADIGGTGKATIDEAIKASKTEVAEGKNVTVTTEKGTNGQTIYTVATKDDVSFNKVTTGTGTNQVILDNTGVNVGGNTYISDAGLNANSKKVTNVANGAITADSKDAVNGGQLYDTHQAIGQLANQTVNLGNQLNNRIGDVEDKANAGVSSAMAMASLPQAYIPGKSMLTGGLATYNGEGAVAVGLSKLSDNGRWVLKMSGSADTKGNAGASIGAGFHF